MNEKKSYLYYLNKIVLQWFGLRLARKVDDQENQIGWHWLTNIKPLSGWNGEYEPWFTALKLVKKLNDVLVHFGILICCQKNANGKNDFFLITRQ
jgi:hypothetical protein